MIIPGTPSILLPPSYRGADMQYIAKKGGLTDGLRCTIDLGSKDCYSGSGQTVTDLSGTGTDFYLGTTSGSDATDPTFNGTAGGVSSGEYLSSDGGDVLTLAAGANPSWMEPFHKAGATFTLLFWYYFPATGLGTAMLAGNTGSAGTGIFIQQNSGGGAPALIVWNAGSLALTRFFTGSGGPAGASWNFAAISVAEGVASGSFGRVNVATATNTNTYSSPASGSASQTFQLLARGSSSTPAKSGYRLAAFQMWDRTLKLEQLNWLFRASRGRFGV